MPQQPEETQADLPFAGAETEAPAAEQNTGSEAAPDDAALAAAAGLLAEEPLAFGPPGSSPAVERPADSSPDSDPAAGFPAHDLDLAAKHVDALHFAAGFEDGGADEDAPAPAGAGQTGQPVQETVDAPLAEDPAPVSMADAAPEAGDETAAAKPDTAPESPATAEILAEAAPEPAAHAARRPGVLAHLAAVRRLPPQALAEAAACAEALKEFAQRG
ncbi:hypothetical protein [Cribrihabitans neustonicus]|uniref:hypothetical protein n=1 Tax=Cribrihabitans neustonicus TaxID=1429085 RepID=UPI003B58E335